MKKWFILGIGILCMFSLSSFTKNAFQHYIAQSDEITAVINKDTTEKELDDLKNFFAENNIELLVKKIAYNKQNELTSLSITLKKGNSKSQYASSSNTPISEIELGYKDGVLFINNSGTFDIASMGKQFSFTFPKVSMDSIMKQHGFAFNFNQDADSLLFKGQINIQKLKDQLMNSFSFDQDKDGNPILNGHPLHAFKGFQKQKFNFVDNPDIEKLIIVDGKESNFETLSKLAKKDQLDEVDFLKPEIATSIYGDKAKDGAIIAITKK